MSPSRHDYQLPPFPSFPAISRYEAIGSQHEAFGRISRGVEAWESISLVMGPPGTGKSLIGQKLAQAFAEQREVILLGDSTIESPADLLRHVLHRLRQAEGISNQALQPGDDVQLELVSRLSNSSDDFPGLLLIVDEAQSLDEAVLETIRILTNTMANGQPRVSAVLLGGPRLDETLAIPSLEPFVQRVATRCYVHPFNSEETKLYIKSVIASCGSVVADTIEESAIEAIHHACNGVPRLINQLMTAAVDVAAQNEQDRIDTGTVNQAWSLLQQLPSPMVELPPMVDPDKNESEFQGEVLLQDGPTDDASADSSVEFGPLSEWDPKEVADTVETFTELEPSHAAIAEESVETVAVEEPEMEAPADAAESFDLSPLSIDCQAIADPSVLAADTTIAIAVDEIPSTSSSPVTLESTPSDEDLFGEFEDEEPLDGSRTTPAPITNSHPDPKAYDVPTQTESLEDSLHEEILSLRGTAASATVNNDPPLAPKTEPVADVDDGLEEPDYDPVVETNPAPVLWVADDENTGITVDDRDLLIIEEDLQVSEGVVVSDSDVEADDCPAPTVDFRAMLAKMRSPVG
ncbi:MAG: AAA family ATPase [Planctomycetota bacterium]